jgi:hypothetical protein
MSLRQSKQPRLRNRTAVAATAAARSDACPAPIMSAAHSIATSVVCTIAKSVVCTLDINSDLDVVKRGCLVLHNLGLDTR